VQIHPLISRYIEISSRTKIKGGNNILCPPFFVKIIEGNIGTATPQFSADAQIIEA
jgi:hypothetical protein